MSAEVVAVRLGTALVGRAARLLLTRGQKGQSQWLEMDELIRVRVSGIRSQRSIRRQFEQIADSVAARLEPMLANEYRSIDEGERMAVTLAVVEAFERTDLSDEALFRTNADSVQLARMVRQSIEPPIGFSDAGMALYEQMLNECCDYYVRIVKHLPVFSDRAISEILDRTSEIGVEISQIIERLPARSFYAPEGEDHDQVFLGKYLELISNSLDDVEMFSFASERPICTKLSMAYISLRVASNSSSRLKRRQRLDMSVAELISTRRSLINIEQDATRFNDEESSGMRVEAALSGHARILLRGEAGSGKTTLLRWLAVTAARGAFVGNLASWNGLVPIFIKLRSYSARPLPALNELLDDSASTLTSLMPRGWVDRQLQAGRVLLLVDGVDELLPKDRRNVRKWLRLLLLTYEKLRVVVTSRPAAARQDWLTAQNFLPLSLERMSRADLNSFIRQWYHAAGAEVQDLPCPLEELPEYERALRASLQDRPDLYSLASSPLLAAMLCSLNLSRYRQLPRNRMELYQIAVELLVQRRDADRHVPSANSISLSLTEKLSLLRDLAWRLSDNNRSELGIERAKGYVASKIASMRHLKVHSDEVMDYLLVRSGVLRTPVEGRMDFVHRTFQEYLAAAEAAEEDRMGNLIGRAHLDLWRETIIMAAGHANRSQRTELISGILKRASQEPRYRRRLRLLAVSCLETIESITDDVAEGIDAALDELIPPRRYEDAWSLALIGEPVRRRLPANLDTVTPVAAAATVRTAALLGGENAYQLLAAYARDSRHIVHDALTNSWLYLDDPARYLDEVLAKIELEEGGLVIDVSHPVQWELLNRLGNVSALSVEFPVNLGELKFSGLPKLHSLSFQRLSGINNLGHLFEASEMHSLDTLRLAGWGEKSEISGLSDLSRFDDLQILDIREVSQSLPVQEWPLSENVKILGIDPVPEGSEFSFLERMQDLYYLHLGGVHARSVAMVECCHSRVVSFGNCDLSSHLEQIITSLPKAERIDFHSVILPEDISPLAELSKLYSIRLIKCSGPEGRPLDLRQLSHRIPDTREVRIRALWTTILDFEHRNDGLGLTIME